MVPPPTPQNAKDTQIAKDKGGPTAGEAYVFYYVIKNMKSKPDVDWEGVATDAGFKNGEVAKVRYGQIRRKLGVDGGGAGPKVSKPRVGLNKVSKPPVRRTKAAEETAKGKAAKAAGAILSSLEATGRNDEMIKDEHPSIGPKQESPDHEVIGGIKQE